MKKFWYSWDHGFTDLFLYLEDRQTPQIFDVEFDCNELHAMCGGRTTHTSRSWLQGEGFLERLGSLIPVGTWRVDTKWNDEFQNFVSIGTPPYMPDVTVAIPYVSHEENKEKTLRDHPVVIKYGMRIFYCEFYTNFTDTLKLILSGGILPEYEDDRRVKKTLRKTFTKSEWSTKEVEVEIDFYNLFQSPSDGRTPNPWEFFRDELSSFKTDNNQDRIFDLLSVIKMEDGHFCRLTKIGRQKYRGELLEANPLETGELTAGWQRITEDVMIRYYNNEKVHLLAYASKEVYTKKINRLAQKMGEGEEFVKFLESTYQGEYEEFELLVPKALYMLDSTNIIAGIRKDLVNKINENFRYMVRQWIFQITDESLLDAIPEDLIISIDDSLKAGNCLPGTEAFIKEHFPGQTETIAKELKKYADNYNVMRIFRFLAAEGRFELKSSAKS